eukprot:CAMPEP_0206619402 /NCGR_PEP_ID=MMETSP0325_2-20121206/60801_1 /ASSEMBLY_ACC=CAM_ASM_000347 /TAXON_ID=2866 /ORGANISM="Crypthecodinium cohnii, Strain Seligo" /LENGTH=77 /DNA_ID=CAMNT_0054141753 /DNA_START=578 /DNA_END=807 /DNA_ORIENTATION=+
MSIEDSGTASARANDGEAWRLREKTHASCPSSSGKTNEKTSVIQTRRYRMRLLVHMSANCRTLCPTRAREQSALAAA